MNPFVILAIVVKFGGLILKEKISSLAANVQIKNSLFYKKLRNRTPDGLKRFVRKNILKYSSVLIIALFVFVSSFAHAQESGEQVLSNSEVMDVDPVAIANVVSAVSPYTPNYQEDPVQTYLAMKNVDYLGKPIITETVKTEQPQESRKNNITYTVEGGDTLSSIGWKYGIKIATIKATNNLTSDSIKPGQQLKLPPGDLSASALKSIDDKKKQIAGAATKFNPSGGSGAFGRPTSGWNMSQPFGHTSFERWHTGVDLTSRSGLNIYASAAGRVIATRRGWGGGYGNHIIIDHGNGFTTLYGHMSSFSVSQGQTVGKGQSIGIMGNTGWSTGTHVHFEIRKNGVAQNPMSYL